jgi:hypothetical protein
MSAYTIEYTTATGLSEKSDAALICLGDRYIMNARFQVGKKPNIDDVDDIKWLNRIIQNNECHTSCRIEDVKETLNKILNLY